MKGPRLMKSKTFASADTLPAPDYQPRGRSNDDPLPIKTSFDDLRGPDGRQKLRDQMSSHFGSQASSLKSSPSSMDVRRERLTVGHNAAAKSSTSSVESVGNGQKRLPVVPEKNNAAIDVEQAINLLQELKKSATPDQLVALHKALLPTRDSVMSLAEPSAARSSLVRRSSMQPPGLATRGGASEDLLRRQEDVPPVPRKQTNGLSSSHARLQSKSSIAALDLADDYPNTQRSDTPSDEQSLGSYRHGTLRVTNGTASPEPSLRPRPSLEGLLLSTSTEEALLGRTGAESLAKRMCEGSPDASAGAQGPTLESSGGRAQTDWPLSPSLQPAKNRALHPHHSLAAEASANITHDSSPARQPWWSGSTSSAGNPTASRKVSRDSLARPSIEASLRGTDSVRNSIDDGRVSPVEKPQFAQRWSHRGKHISQEHLNDGAVPLSPRNDTQDSPGVAQRLSTVFDGEDPETQAGESSETALSRLEGRASHSHERSSLQATAYGLNSPTRPPFVSSQSESRVPRKADSGYVSDASHQSHQGQRSVEVSGKNEEAPRIMEDRPTGRLEKAALSNDEGGENQSLYTLEQMLRMPTFRPSAPKPSKPDTAKKHSSLLKLTSLKKASLTASKPSQETHSSAESLPLPTESGAPSPAEAKPAKPSKKLQKRVPDEVRKQRKALRDIEKRATLQAEPQKAGELVPSDPGELVYSPLPVTEPSTPATMASPAPPWDARVRSTPTEIPYELLGEPRHPAELDTVESAVPPTQSLSRGASRKGRRRSREEIVAGAQGEERKQSKGRRSFSLGRKRSKSRNRSGSRTPKRKSKDVPAVPSIAALSASFPSDGDDESVPDHADYGSMSSALGGNPYDISTEMFAKERNTMPASDQLQSPHQITAFMHRTKSGGLAGMDSVMASELARLKSRDVAIQNNEDVFDAPRMATPKKRGQTTQVPARPWSTMPNAPAIGQRTPGWDTKPVFQNNVPGHAELRARRHSISESIPSLPELPVDVEAKFSKAAKYLTKRTTPKAFPVRGSSPSPVSPLAVRSPGQSGFFNGSVAGSVAKPNHPGFSNESVADAITSAVQARRSMKSVKGERKAERLQPAGPRMHSHDSTGMASLQLHGADERPESQSSASILIGVGSDRDDQEGRQSTTPEQEREAASVWDRQAQLWHERRESTGEPLGKPVRNEAPIEQPGTSPAIVVSRYVTPSTADIPQGAHRRTNSASEHADAYRDLIGVEDESWLGARPNDRTSVQTTSTATDRTSTDTVTGETALPAKVYQAPPPTRERSIGGRVRTPSGAYHPYTPDRAAQAERSRAHALALLEGNAPPRNPPPRSTRPMPPRTQSLDVQRRPPHHQQSDTIESIVNRYDRSLSPIPASEAGSGSGSNDTPQHSRQSSAATGPMIDRYSGGLQYGYERGVGVQGSSGLRNGVSVHEGASRPSEFGQSHGLDLGDVPVFLKRATYGV